WRFTSLIMSSVITLRLKHRKAFSRDSPSCNRTSAKIVTPAQNCIGLIRAYSLWLAVTGISRKTSLILYRLKKAPYPVELRDGSLAARFFIASNVQRLDRVRTLRRRVPKSYSHQYARNCI